MWAGMPHYTPCRREVDSASVFMQASPVLTYPEMDPILFEWGIVKVRWYGLMYVIGFVIAWYLARRRAEQPAAIIKPAQVDDLIFYCMLGVLLGGRLGYVFVYGLDQFMANWRYIYRFDEGGMSFHGGLAGVMVAMWLFAKLRGIGMLAVWDFVAPLAPLGLFFGRIGNFINGELWGKPTDLPWGFKVGDQVLHPSMLYEAILEGLVLFAILWTFSAKPRPCGSVSGLFLLLYGLFRFLVEFVRVPDSQLGYLAGGWVTMGQVLSLPMMILGGTMVYLAYRSPKEATA